MHDGISCPLYKTIAFQNNFCRTLDLTIDLCMKKVPHTRSFEFFEKPWGILNMYCSRNWLHMPFKIYFKKRKKSA